MEKIKKFIIYTDGAARGNPGPAAAAYLIKNEAGEVLTKGGVTLGISTNNQAEYQAVRLALKKLGSEFKDQLPADIEIRSDSELLVGQLSGRFKVKNQQLKIFFDQIKLLEFEVGRVSYRRIPRQENFQADQLVNSIL